MDLVHGVKSLLTMTTPAAYVATTEFLALTDSTPTGRTVTTVGAPCLNLSTKHLKKAESPRERVEALSEAEGDMANELKLYRKAEEFLNKI